MAETDKELPEENKPEATAEDLQEKKVKIAFVEKFRLEPKPAGGGETAQTTTAEDEAAADNKAEEKIYQQMANLKGSDYFVWRVKKRTLLVILGTLLGGLWLVSISRLGIETYLPRLAIWNPELRMKMNQIPTVSPTPVMETQASPATRLKIRVRNNSEASGSAQTLVDYLRAQGYAQTEVVDDFQSEYVGVSIITKPNGLEVRNGLINILKDKYKLSSPSAELTPDSDYDVVILFAPRTKDFLLPTKKPTAIPTIATTSASLP